MKKNYFFLALVLFGAVLFAQNIDFNNGANDGGLWTTPGNWTPPAIANPSPTPISTYTVRTVNPAESFVNTNFTIFRLQNTNAVAGDRFVNSSSGGILTIDQNVNNDVGIAIQNVSGTGVKLALRGLINIQNSFTGKFSRITNANSAANSIEFENSSILTLTTPLEVFKTANANGANNFFFNGKIEGSANFRVALNTTATFGNSVSNAGYSGELVLFANSSLIVNTTDNVVFYDGPKIQVNGTDASATLNGQNVFQGSIVVGGTNTFNLNVNKNQIGINKIIFAGAGTLNMVIDNTVTGIAFANSSSSWDAAATLNITGFTNGVIRFGTDNSGLDETQLSQIVLDDVFNNPSLDENGYLVSLPGLSVDDVKENTVSPIAYPTLATDKIYFKTLQNDVKIFDLNGKMLLNNTSNNQSEAAINKLASGLYLIVFDNNKVEKFIKK